MRGAPFFRVASAWLSLAACNPVSQWVAVAPAGGGAALYATSPGTFSSIGFVSPRSDGVLLGGTKLQLASYLGGNMTSWALLPTPPSDHVYFGQGVTADDAGAYWWVEDLTQSTKMPAPALWKVSTQGGLPQVFLQAGSPGTIFPPALDSSSVYWVTTTPFGSYVYSAPR